MDNKVFFQHPDLMRALCLHETVMQLMVNTLNKAQQQQSATGGDMNVNSQRRTSAVPAMGLTDSAVNEQTSKVGEIIWYNCNTFMNLVHHVDFLSAINTDI